ncbi:uncharacterized protein LOC124823361 isoform X1 [Vigna umbellata]|uniref:uncharacterized protein LOC124823361 isoform X1 n=1 Tax=Vigna umbellata TaxID=87088 RepID=UPI001F5E39ED|nr:uncharacterized protein LOC124823361 isoform X1 [Vigna umbellata]
MAISLNSIVSFSSTKLETKYHDASRYSVGASLPKATRFTPFSVVSRSRKLVKERRFGHCLPVADSDQLAADNNITEEFDNAENSPTSDQLSSLNPPDENFQLQAKVDAESVSKTLDSSNGSINQEQGSSSAAASSKSQSATKGASLTARERLKAARAGNRNPQSKASKADMSSRVLEASKQSDKGKRKSGLPEAPTNLFDDSKRGLSTGFTFQFPGGSDLFLIVFSFVLISSIMFATTFIVWKVGAIHFNEY